jgi:inorganic pyrophosphatase
MESRNLNRLPPFDKESGALNIVAETPKNGRLKCKYNEKNGMFQLDKTLPYGFSFPFEFGFVPSTTGGDGDPLDALLLSDEATFPGCLVLGQVLGVLQAEQREGKKVNRNDRLVAIPLSAKTQEPIIPAKTLDEE